MPEYCAILAQDLPNCVGVYDQQNTPLALTIRHYNDENKDNLNNVDVSIILCYNMYNCPQIRICADESETTKQTYLSGRNPTMGWKYRGRDVQVPRTADIPPQFWSTRERSRAVQRVLDMVEPWKIGDDPIETHPLEGERFMPIVVSLNGRKPMWGIHAGHHARKPQASPFIRVDYDRTPRTNLFTIELEQSPERPRLVRAYPGDYIPPLPWMGSAADADGGMKACIDFWRSHAYVFSRSVMLRQFDHAPNWFRP